MMSRLLVVIPTYARPLDRVMRCLESVRAGVPGPYLGGIVVVDQNPLPLELPDWVQQLRAEPGYPGPRRHLGALAAARGAGPEDVFLFLDDDIELVDWERYPQLLDGRDPDGVLAQHDTGCVQVAARWWHRTMPLDLGDTAGGILVRVPAYFEIGGFGEDYLDDVELFARALIGGKRNWRTTVVRSLHHYGSGGLKDYLGVSRAGRAHLSRSKLEERYPAHLMRDAWRWTGYRYLQEPPAESTRARHSNEGQWLAVGKSQRRRG